MRVAVGSSTNRRQETGYRLPATGVFGLALVIVLAGTGSAQTLTPEEMKVLQEVEEVGKRYESASAAHQETMRGILRREYGDRMRLLSDRFDSGVGEAEKDYRKRLASTMELLKQFL